MDMGVSTAAIIYHDVLDRQNPPNFSAFFSSVACASEQGLSAPECHALTPRGNAFPHEEAAPVAHRLSSFMVPFALVNPVRTTR
jgi:hypothetical protein